MIRLRHTLLVAAVILGFGALVGCSDDDAPPDEGLGAEWPVFTDQGLGLEFRMPSDPDTLTQRVQLPDGTQSEIVVHVVEAADLELFVSTFPVDPDAYQLDGAADGAAAAVNGEVRSVDPITVDGNPGRDAEIAFTVDGEPRVLLYRAVLLDVGLVQAQTLGPAANRAELDRHHRALVAGLDLP